MALSCMQPGLAEAGCWHGCRDALQALACCSIFALGFQGVIGSIAAAALHPSRPLAKHVCFPCSVDHPLWQWHNSAGPHQGEFQT